MSDNSPSSPSDSASDRDRHTRPNFQPEKADPIGVCLRKAFDDADQPEDESGSLGKLLKMLARVRS